MFSQNHPKPDVKCDLLHPVFNGFDSYKGHELYIGTIPSHEVSPGISTFFKHPHDLVITKFHQILLSSYHHKYCQKYSHKCYDPKKAFLIFCPPITLWTFDGAPAPVCCHTLAQGQQWIKYISPSGYYIEIQIQCAKLTNLVKILNHDLLNTIISFIAS